jgi:hypothetical protein
MVHGDKITPSLGALSSRCITALRELDVGAGVALGSNALRSERVDGVDDGGGGALPARGAEEPRPNRPLARVAAARMKATRSQADAGVEGVRVVLGRGDEGREVDGAVLGARLEWEGSLLRLDYGGLEGFDGALDAVAARGVGGLAPAADVGIGRLAGGDVFGEGAGCQGQGDDCDEVCWLHDGIYLRTSVFRMSLCLCFKGLTVDLMSRNVECGDDHRADWTGLGLDDTEIPL